MKCRLGFVTNSSSTSFIITNHTDVSLSVFEFAKENLHLLHEFIEEFDWYESDNLYTEENFLASAAEDGRMIEPGENEVIFGDESGTVIGTVFDYELRYGGSSERFSWRFHESCR